MDWGILEGSGVEWGSIFGTPRECNGSFATSGVGVDMGSSVCKEWELAGDGVDTCNVELEGFSGKLVGSLMYFREKGDG